VVLLQTMRGFFDLLQSSVKQSRQRMYLVPPVFAQLTEQHRRCWTPFLPVMPRRAQSDDGAPRFRAHHD
jgi:hypothetical protein